MFLNNNKAEVGLPALETIRRIAAKHGFEVAIQPVACCWLTSASGALRCVACEAPLPTSSEAPDAPATMTCPKCGIDLFPAMCPFCFGRGSLPHVRATGRTKGRKRCGDCDGLGCVPRKWLRPREGSP